MGSQQSDGSGQSDGEGLRTTLALQVGLSGVVCGNTVGTQGILRTPFLPLGFQPRAHHLLNAWLVRVEQRPGLHVLRYKAAAHPGDVLPVSQSRQCHVLVCGLPLTCGGQWIRCIHLASSEPGGPESWPVYLTFILLLGRQTLRKAKVLATPQAPERTWLT